MTMDPRPMPRLATGMCLTKASVAIASALITLVTTPYAGACGTAMGPPPYNAPQSSPGRSFMQIDGIVGDVRDERHTGWLKVDNFVVQCLAPGHPPRPCPAGTDAEITVSRHIDAFSRQLGKACVDHTHFPKIVVETFLGGDPGDDWVQFTYTLRDAWIEDCSINWTGFTEEVVGLRAARIEESQGWDEHQALSVVPLPRHP